MIVVKKGVAYVVGSLFFVTLILPGCETTNGQGASTGQRSYAKSCLTGGALAAGAMYLWDTVKNKNSSRSTISKDGLLKAAAAGCVIGLAATAIGELLDERQRAKHEEAMQREAKRRALEQQQYAAMERRYQSMPAATPQQQAKRDEALERARTEWLEKYQKPVVVDLGNGATSTITAVPPSPQALPVPSKQGGVPAMACVDSIVFVETPAGKAKQQETWCSNSAGQMARVEVSDAQPT